MREVGAEHRPYSSAESATAEKLRRRAIAGPKKQIAARLSQLAKDLDLNEMVVVTWTYDPAPRHRSYELLAQAFEWPITRRFSIPAVRLTNGKHTANKLFSDRNSLRTGFEMGRKLSSLIRMYVQPLRKPSAVERTGSICACRVVDLSTIRRLLLFRCP